MNFLDIGIFTVLFYNIVSGLKKGLIRSVFEILALFGGVILAILYYQDLASFFNYLFKMEHVYAVVFSFILIWCVGFIVITLIGQFLHQFLNFSILNWVNYGSGGVLGFFKGFAVLLPFIIPMFYFEFKPVEKSFFLTTFSPVFRYIMDKWVPVDIFNADLTQMSATANAQVAPSVPVPPPHSPKKAVTSPLVNNPAAKHVYPAPKALAPSHKPVVQTSADKEKELARLLKKNNLDMKTL